MSTLFGVPVDAVYHLVFALTNVLTPVLGGLAAVAGIILVTMAVRLLVSPLTFRALWKWAARRWEERDAVCWSTSAPASSMRRKNAALTNFARKWNLPPRAAASLNF